MNLTLKESTFSLMNYLGKHKIPFIFIIDFEMENPIAIPLSEIEHHEILYDMEGFANFNPGEKCISPKIEFQKKAISFFKYKKSFDLVQKNLKEGNSYLLNLTFPTKIKTNLTLKEIFYLSKAKYRLYFKDLFIVFSPETFIKIYNNKIYSFPMKGTIKADIPDAEKILMEDEKEKAEHITIVDLIRNDLSIVAKNVTVTRFRYLDEVETHSGKLLQTSSEICGELPPHWNAHIGDILISLLPAGSITGAPKKKTVEIVKKSEIDSRGFYTGICGYFDGSFLNSAVMIRFIEKRHNNLIYRSGGGITIYSDPESEYKEMVDKVYVPFC